MKDKRINDRYQIIRSVGGGGMADVYLAKDLILDREVAVKMLKSQFSNDEEFIRRFRREAQSATSLSHPNVVTIYDVGEEENLYYIVMEYVDGMTLKSYIQQSGGLSVAETVRILGQITSAVGHAHDNHIIHRDLKPHNILMGPDGIAKVTDFGIARAISEATITHTNSVLGSVHYLSPEQAKGGQVTLKSDLYSVGIITFEMLTGEVPFQGDTAVSVAIKQLQEPLPDIKEKVPGLPQSMANFITKATAKDPDERYYSAHEMETDLSTLLNPDRRNETPKYISSQDDEMTKAVPVVGKNESGSDFQNTMVVPNSSKVNSEQTKVGKENDAVSKSKKPKGARFWFKLSLLAILFLIGIFIVSFYLIPSLLHVNDVEIPEGIVGMEYEEAAETLAELNLEVEQEMRHDDEMEADHVISLNPGEGESVKEGTLITVYVSEGMEPIEMRDITGETRESAETLLEEYEFESVEVQYEETSQYDDDTVINQSPGAREMVIPSETVVTLTVSERPTYIMSNLFGMTQEEVIETTADNPLLSMSFEEEYHPTMEEGSVVSQDPARGTEIRERTTVNVVISRGPEPVEVPEPEPQEELEEPEEELEPITATVPFVVEVSETEEANGDPRVYRIRISVTDMENRTPNQLIDEEITETTTFDLPMTVAPEDSGFLILQVDDEEFEDSPYEYTYEELQQFE
ncbi:serine/threonine protein kinase [Salipaludibacillus neizhouensis]|uniref:Serine/threonine-protein kinase PrkC n=1 Tax=Salipaludibacillus neizhouensis TaxID=885475 RepID=A0A3A9KBG3_9BACI|nr:Stk1 family PASTA domain-containing Ser/Thr kinase [Salipaludibacillus neizhouensis]RKL68948.1 serine/threonine protein kinase [Salipaludibacillus neizhouensis]